MSRYRVVMKDGHPCWELVPLKETVLELLIHLLKFIGFMAVAIPLFLLIGYLMH